MSLPNVHTESSLLAFEKEQNLKSTGDVLLQRSESQRPEVPDLAATLYRLCTVFKLPVTR